MTMKTKVIKYDAAKPLSLVETTIEDRFATLKEDAHEYDYSQGGLQLDFKRLCLNICYKVMIVAIGHPVDQKSYSIENICFEIPGMVGTEIHDVLDALSNLGGTDTTVDEDVLNCDKLLNTTLLPEFMQMFKIPITAFYCAMILFRNSRRPYEDKELVEHARTILLTEGSGKDTWKWEFLYNRLSPL